MSNSRTWLRNVCGILVLLILVNSAVALLADDHPEKRIVATTEIIPNYLLHLYVVGEVWKDRNMDNPGYRSAYSRFVRQEDIAYIREHRDLLVWGNGKSGVLTPLLFFLPTKTGKIDDKAKLEQYLTLAKATFKDTSAFDRFNKTYPDLAVPDAVVDMFWKSKDSYQDVFFQMADILVRNFDAYAENVWPMEKTKLDRTARLLEQKFKGSYCIERWEGFVQTKFPADSFQIVLTTANKGLPSANDLAPSRYNFYFSSEDTDSFVDLIHHEIGTNLLKEYRFTLEKDSNVCRAKTSSGDCDAVIWRAFESLAEFYKEKVLSSPRKAWTGKAFDGKAYDFPIFFKVYDAEYAKTPHLAADEMMRRGIDRFLSLRDENKDRSVPLLANESSRIQVTANFSEADAVLAILQKREARQRVSEADWQVLFATEPFQRLKKRETSMKRSFTDDDFRNFVLSDDLLSRYAGLRTMIAQWKQVDLAGYASRILPYLPPESVIRAKVYPVIKPKNNSFVFEIKTDPAIFLYVNPGVSTESFANTVAHEMHRIGLSSVNKQYDGKIASLPDRARTVAGWMSAFGEGEAMLAAAGGPEADPVATATPELKANWKRGELDFNQDLQQVNAFFLDVLDGKLQGDAIGEKAFSFFGLQGRWYTVGYRMAVMVEKGYGKDGLIECMRDHRLLLARYNQITGQSNRNGGPQLDLWSPQILEAIQIPSAGVK